MYIKYAIMLVDLPVRLMNAKWSWVSLLRYIALDS